ncbi:hypothetical protein [Imhoffiella purpurea]|uniref:Uncharacterized protein n=1 Tax=Imhoffiella purpurea TaxID=1249627 RepID=W9W1G6_9GAMM|nr:hypothetical protein [Imhoffiella purpurea]EXJ16440.1 hypothetical protein D779_0172 [Imhoffiella purpurea]
MARFQALTNAVLEAELDLLRERFGLGPNQKADLLREMAAIAGWAARQAEEGRVIEARRGEAVERLLHPALERLSRAAGRSVERFALNDAEVERLASILDKGFDPSPALRTALANLAQSPRRPPSLSWPGAD